MDLTPLPPPPRSTLLNTSVQLAEASISVNTRRAYTTALTQLRQYLHREGEPLTDSSLAMYLTFLFEQGKAPASAAIVVSAIRFQCRLANKPSIVGRNTDQVLKGFRRKGGERGYGQVKGVRWEQADVAAAMAAASQSLTGLRDAAIIATASDALLRASEISALLLEDLDVAPSGDGTLLIRHSKTDQEYRGAKLYLGEPTIKHLQAWIQASEIEDGVLFRRIRRGDKICIPRMTTAAFRYIIRNRCAAVGITGQISTHSLRIGAAQSLANAGASLVQMQNAGRWQSSRMPAAYTAGEMATRGAVAKLRYNRR